MPLLPCRLYFASRVKSAVSATSSATLRSALPCQLPVTMLEVAADPRHLGARIGFLSILHTWGQNLRLHPHLHCVDSRRRPRSRLLALDSSEVCLFFLPVKVLSRVFRGKYLALLEQALRQRRSDYPSTLVRLLLKDDWVVYAKASAFHGEPARDAAVSLGRYTHRVAISNDSSAFSTSRRSTRKLPMERLRAWQQAAHHDLIRERVPAPIPANMFCPEASSSASVTSAISPALTVYLSPRACSPAARLPASTKFTSNQLPVSHLALPTLRSQHEHRAQPHRATTGPFDAKLTDSS